MHIGRSGWIVAVALAALFTLFVWLGRWQLQRMHEKELLFAEFESGALITLPLSQVDVGGVARYQHVIATGHFDSQRQILLDNMTHQGRAGYRVLTPLRGPDAPLLLVDRGWVPAPPQRSTLPDIAVSGELRGIAGKLDRLPRAGIELRSVPSQGWPRVMSYPTAEEVQAALGETVLPWIVLLDADQADGYVRAWRPSTFPPERHYGYAVTWFALAATVLITALILIARRRQM